MDKNTKAKYAVGQEVDFPVDRAKEILCTGYAVYIEEPKEEVKEVVKKVKETKPAVATTAKKKPIKK